MHRVLVVNHYGHLFCTTDQDLIAVFLFTWAVPDSPVPNTIFERSFVKDSLSGQISLALSTFSEAQPMHCTLCPKDHTKNHDV